ncbi:caspase domain-containing protein [Trametes meyenii]|nr:caspase domain-containing protein [Trametes meyenii]
MVKIGPPQRATFRTDDPVKKALVIGINYSDASPTPSSPYAPLTHARDDAKDIASLIVAKYGYRRENIVMLLDEGGDARYAPTRDNILREIHKLVHGARSGDHFFFYYSGHSDQIASEGPAPEEEDGMDEYIVPVDYDKHAEDEPMRKRMILDNKLRKLLVDKLPVGAYLTAIFDSCHSGTLLDLDHYLCNNIYFPWISPGFRNQNTLWRNVRRRDDQHMSQAGVRVIKKKKSQLNSKGRQGSTASQTGANNTGAGVRIYQRKRVSQDEVLVFNTSVDIVDSANGKTRQFSIRRRSKSVKRQTMSIMSQLAEGVGSASQLSVDITTQAIGSIEEFDAPMCASPTEMRTCDGFCNHPDGAHDGPNVLSISACGDSQMTWDSKKHSFTQALIQMLRLEPNQPIGSLIRGLTYNLYDHSRKLHTWSKKRRDSWKRKSKAAPSESGGTDSDAPSIMLELSNFTEPQVGSLRKVRLEEPFNP